MSKKLAFERYYWFHNQIKAGKFPNSKTLAIKFEISQKQAQRDVEFIRDRLNAPLIYDKKRRGYYYESENYELPPLWLKEDDLISLIISYNLTKSIPDKHIKKSLYNIIQSIINKNSNKRINISDFLSKVSVKHIEYYRIDESIFQKVIQSLYYDQNLKIEYYSPHKKEKSERVIKPLHLLCYMGRWHVIAYCNTRKDLRTFALSRIKKIKISDIKIYIPEDIQDVSDYINKTFGLISNNNKGTDVCLEFSAEVADWIKEQIWHEAQIITEKEDGSVCLIFPVTDFLELKGEILKYGSAVKVVYPEELKEEIKKEIEKMKKNYI